MRTKTDAQLKALRKKYVLARREMNRIERLVWDEMNRTESKLDRLIEAGADEGTLGKKLYRYDAKLDKVLN